MKTILEINFKNKEHLQLLTDFYDTVYAVGFPDEDERESLENIIKQAAVISDSDRAEYHCMLACMNGRVVGGIIGDYFAEGNCGVVEFLIVSKLLRKNCFGRELLAYLTEQFHRDARGYGYVQGMDYCFFETENPWKRDVTVRNTGIQRLKILSRLTTGIVDMEYIQPPWEEGSGRWIICIWASVC